MCVTTPCLPSFHVLKMIFICVHVCLCVYYVCAALSEVRRGQWVDLLELSSRCHKLPSVSAGNQALVICKSRKSF